MKSLDVNMYDTRSCHLGTKIYRGDPIYLSEDLMAVSSASYFEEAQRSTKKGRASVVHGMLHGIRTPNQS